MKVNRYNWKDMGPEEKKQIFSRSELNIKAVQKQSVL